jgi:hypothetical protein
MNPLPQGFGDHHPASTAVLTRTGGIHREYLPTSFRRFVGQYPQELPPAGVQYAFGPGTPRHTLYAQLLHRDNIVPLNQTPRELVVKIAPRPYDLPVLSCQGAYRPAPPMATAPFLADAALRAL